MSRGYITIWEKLANTRYNFDIIDLLPDLLNMFPKNEIPDLLYRNDKKGGLDEAGERTVLHRLVSLPEQDNRTLKTLERVLFEVIDDAETRKQLVSRRRNACCYDTPLQYAFQWGSIEIISLLESLFTPAEWENLLLSHDKFISQAILYKAMEVKDSRIFDYVKLFFQSRPLLFDTYLQRENADQQNLNGQLLYHAYNHFFACKSLQNTIFFDRYLQTIPKKMALRALTYREERGPISSRSIIHNLCTFNQGTMLKKMVQHYNVSNEELLPIFNTKTAYGETPIHCSADTGELATIEYVLSLIDDHTSFLSLPDEKGNTPLHLATMNHRINHDTTPFVKSLSEEKIEALKKIKNNQGQSVFELENERRRKKNKW